MNRILCLTALFTLGAVSVSAAPIVPRIVGYDFNFGAQETINTPFYDPRGALPDLLTLVNREGIDQEVTAFWQIWPVGGVPVPVFNCMDQFGGDFGLYLQFDGEDAMPPHLDVSITGSGRLAGPDLFIWGKIPALGITNCELLVSIDVEQASLYGYGGKNSFVLETLGVFEEVNPLIPGAFDLIGEPAASRGNIDFEELRLSSLYDPLVDYGLLADGGGYSGEVGYVPEPAAFLLWGLAAVVSMRRR